MGDVHMNTLVMDKSATLMQELRGGRHSIETVKYKDLKQTLAGINTLTVSYVYGMRKRRVKKLEEMGYSLQETIWFNDDALHANIRQVWTRTEEHGYKEEV